MNDDDSDNFWGINSIIQPPFMVFKNRGSMYRIRGIPDDVLGVSYSTGQNVGVS